MASAPKKRSKLQQEVVEALISTKAVDFEAVGSVLSKFGARAAREGDAIGVIINWRVIDPCIPVDFEDFKDLLGRKAGGQ